MIIVNNTNGKMDDTEVDYICIELAWKLCKRIAEETTLTDKAILRLSGGRISEKMLRDARSIVSKSV